MNTNDLKVASTNDKDFAQISEWLRKEDEDFHPCADGDAGIEGFYCNLDVIEQAHQEGQMFCAKNSQTTVGFVTVNRRTSGIGRAHV